jgi:hypothetical protein
MSEGVRGARSLLQQSPRPSEMLRGVELARNLLQHPFYGIYEVPLVTLTS